MKLRLTKISIPVAIAGALALSLGLFLFVRDLEFRRLRTEFVALAHDRAHAIAEDVEADLEALEYLTRFHHSTLELEADPGKRAAALRTFIREILEEEPDIVAVQWAQRASAAGRLKDSFPVLLTEPASADGGLLAGDLGRDPAVQDAMGRALESGEIAVSGRTVILKGGAAVTGIAAVVPVYAGSDAEAGETEGELQGFYAITLRVGGMVEEAFKHLAPAGMDVTLWDGPPAAGSLLYHHPSRTRSEAGALDPFREALIATVPVRLGGRDWSVSCKAVDGFYAARRSWGSWAVLVLSLCVSALFIARLVDWRRRTVTIEAEVRERTAELQDEVRQRRKTEEALRHAKTAAEAANHAKGEFLANISHEIRTPMNGVIGMTELCLDTELTEEQRDYLEMVKSSADSLLRVINDVLDFSKIEAGKLELDPEPFELVTRVEEVVRPLGVRAEQKGIELVLRLAPDVPERIVGDAGRLEQVIVNLVGNAIKFTGKGDVLVSADREWQTPDEVCLRFAVRDTGIGIAPEKLTVIFEAFAQADGSSTRQYGGTGLGLSISTQLVEKMGGRIWVESEVGTGSTFYFTARFGIAALPAASGGLRRLDPLQLRDMSVLVVDDNATNRQVLGETLEVWQMRPTLAADGLEALRELTRAWETGEPFPLVLLDAMMPGLDGFEVAAQIRARPELAGVTIMMLSSAGRAEDARRCRALGVECYVCKPLRRSELLATILRVLGEHEALAVCREDRGPATAPGPLRILLAEDNLINQRVAVRMLEKEGHSVLTASSGREALSALDRGSFDLVLMDLQMPELNGFETVKLIRGQEVISGRRMPIIALTAHAMNGDRERCLAAGMDGYLSKPIHAADLRGEIARVVGGLSCSRTPVVA
jgi:signal transduction histidine kinase/CheY-like chemotaxis protein